MSILFESKLAESLDFGHILEIGAKAENEESWQGIPKTFLYIGI